MNRSFWLAVLMVLNSTVCQPAVPLVFGNRTKLDVLAVTFEEDKLCPVAVVAVVSTSISPSPVMLQVIFPILFFMFLFRFSFTRTSFSYFEPCFEVLVGCSLSHD